MLKKICGLFLGLVVLASSACVTPTHASSASPVVITAIQAAGPSGAKDESIVLYNQSDIPVNVTDWCIANKTVRFVCFSRYQNNYPLQLTLPARGYMTVVSEFYSQPTPILLSYASFVYSITNQSSGSIVGSADTISLLDSYGEMMDTYAWSSGAPAGKGWTRTKLASLPDLYATTNGSDDWVVIGWQDLPIDSLAGTLPLIEEEPEEPDPIEPEEPAEPDEPETPDPSLPDPTVLPLIISELLANPLGGDAGNEFIELYNPNETDIEITGTHRLRIGIESPKWVTVPSGTIPAKQFLVMYNDDVPYTLVNSNGTVMLYEQDTPIGPAIIYATAKEGQSWALINGVWQNIKQPSPGFENILSEDEEEIVTEDTTQTPCAVNQFRNPETGRCKLVAVASSSPVPCKTGQERNPETNRCRSLVAANTPTACKPGQERNIETNRCRNVKVMLAAEFGVHGVQQKAGAQLQWYYVVAIGGIVLLILGYAVWEWRQELAVFGQRVKALFIKRVS